MYVIKKDNNQIEFIPDLKTLTMCGLTPKSQNVYRVMNESVSHDPYTHTVVLDQESIEYNDMFHTAKFKYQIIPLSEDMKMKSLAMYNGPIYQRLASDYNKKASLCEFNYKGKQYVPQIDLSHLLLLELANRAFNQNNIFLPLDIPVLEKIEITEKSDLEEVESEQDKNYKYFPTTLTFIQGKEFHNFITSIVLEQSINLMHLSKSCLQQGVATYEEFVDKHKEANKE